MNRILFVDIETIPGEAMPELESIKAPANYKDPEKIKAYQKENQLEVYKKQALNSMEGQIICIGYKIDDDPIYCCLSEEGEVAILDEFQEAIKGFRGQYNEPLIFCGWNIQTFDIPWLWRKSIQYGLTALRNSLPHQNPKMMIDLMKLWASDYRDYVSLADCAKYLGVEHEGSGSEVYDMWKANDLLGIANHCRRDIETTIKVYERMCA